MPAVHTRDLTAMVDAYPAARGWPDGELRVVVDRHGRRGPRRATVASADEPLLRSRTDPACFGAFFDAHYESLLAYFAARVRSAEVAADLCAETFAAALAGVDRFDPRRGNASQWLYGIGRHLLHRYWRDLRVRTEARDGLEMAPIELDDDTAAMIARIDSEAHRASLDEALEQLPNGYRRAVELRVLEELDYEVIAELLGCRPGAARVRVHRGLKRLRDAMEGDDGG